MGRPVSHQLDIYGTWLHVATDRKAWSSLRRRIDSLAAIERYAIGFTSHDVDDDGQTHLSVFIHVDRLRGNPQGLTEIVAHEAAHAAGLLLDHIGQNYDGESEALGYLVGFIAAYVWGVCDD